MPVDRSYIAPYAATDSQAYQALTALANFSDALEKAAGVRVGGTAAAQAPAPAQASWIIAAATGHYTIQITNPAAAGSVAVQHQVRSATNQQFDANSAVSTFTLGLGQTTLDVVDPNLAKYWQIRSRYQGSAWNNWLTYANASGVVALNAGVLRTS
ncbi:MAG TPA: hypothetical protein VNF74_11360 [Terriglobales bacterium]|nr:hypothetical protein [Terriglobales bacterium]